MDTNTKTVDFHSPTSIMDRSSRQKEGRKQWIDNTMGCMGLMNLMDQPTYSIKHPLPQVQPLPEQITV
jgi:hypothetical protein